MKLPLTPFFGVLFLLISQIGFANNRFQETVTVQDSTTIIEDSSAISTETDEQEVSDSELGNIIPQDYKPDL